MGRIWGWYRMTNLSETIVKNPQVISFSAPPKGWLYCRRVIKCVIKWSDFFFSIFNTLRPRQNGRHLADYIFKRIIMNENVRISIKISLKFVRKFPINNIPSLVQIMAWRRPGDRPLSEPMMARLPTHICVTRPQWVKDGSLCTYTISPPAYMIAGGCCGDSSEIWRGDVWSTWFLWHHG